MAGSGEESVRLSYCYYLGVILLYLSLSSEIFAEFVFKLGTVRAVRGSLMILAVGI